MSHSIKRIIKIGWKEFKRNKGLSIATLLIMTMVTSLITILFLLNSVSQKMVSDIENKVDISVYFADQASEEEIDTAKSEIAKISEVKEVEYISKNQALESFIEDHRNDPLLVESLTELGYNPFLSSLNIKAWEASQYEQVTNLLESGSFQEIIDKVDYHQRKEVIDKIFGLTNSINTAGLFLTIILAVMAVLIAFNTTRIAIYNSKEEVSVMRLVGASNNFVRGPFLIQGAIIGVISAILTFILTIFISFLFDSQIKSFTSSISIFNIFVSNIWIILLIQLAVGVGLGIISSYIAIRKYLKA